MHASHASRLRGFNSIVVRLKEAAVPSESPPDPISFNSIVVRLKVLCHDGAQETMSFNSIVVRLKVGFAIMETQAVRGFQFHSGSIKSYPRGFS